MGVTYKLRQDVVEFIMSNKRNDPSISCRKMVGIIKERFNSDVSKSSVNEVFKGCELSAPVGRPARKAPKNFVIPSDKKELLLKNVAPFLGSAEVMATKTAVATMTTTTAAAVVDAPVETVMVVESEPVTVAENEHDLEPEAESMAMAALSGRGVPEVLAELESQVDPVDEPLTLRPDPVAGSTAFLAVSDFQVEAKIAEIKERRALSQKPADWLGEEGAMYGRLGAAALWFAFIAACDEGLLGEYIARRVGKLPEGMASRDCAILLFEAFFTEVRDSFGMQDIRTLCRLAGIEDNRGREFLDTAAILDNDRSTLTMLETELTMAFTSVRYFRLLTAQGGRFYLDAAVLVLHDEIIDAGRVSSILPIFMAVEKAVDRIITNCVPFVATLPAYGITAQSRRFIELMEGAGKDAISAVELIGDNDIKTAEFTAIPRMRRMFILRVKLTDEERAGIEYPLIENRKTFSDQVTGNTCRYLEGTLRLEGLPRALRVLLIDPAQGESFSLLSNTSAVASSAEDVVANFYRMENQGCEKAGAYDRPAARRTLPSAERVSGLFRKIEVNVREFFLGVEAAALTWEDMCQILYDLPGRLKEQPETLLVRFELPEGYAHSIRLELFLQRLNRAALKTPDGRRIIFSFAPLPLP